jgi:hypothetical protein
MGNINLFRNRSVKLLLVENDQIIDHMVRVQKVVIFGV